MFRQLFLKKKYSLQLGFAILIALLTFVGTTMSASARTLSATQASEIAPQCEVFEQNLLNIENTIAILTNELNKADFSERSVIAHEILQETNLENQQRAKLNACIAADPGLPPLSTTLTGTITFATNFNGSDFQEHATPIQIGIVFSAFRDQVIFSFPSVNVPGFPISVTESVVSENTGTFSETTGAISVATELQFSAGVFGSSTADFTFTTGNSVSPDGVINLTGIPLNRQTKSIDLVGTTHFGSGDGPLAGSDGLIFISGTLGELP
jgi:hypothetical protein